MPCLTRKELLCRAAAAGTAFALPGLLAACDSDGDGEDAFRPASALGRLPPDGNPTVEGLSLPRGRSWRSGQDRFDEWVPALGTDPVFWCTDEGTGRAFGLAAALAARHPQTGLWPLLWLYPSDRPAGYLGHPRRIARVNAARAERALAAVWERDPPKRSWVFPLGTAFPGLAESTGPPGRNFDPFVLLRARQRADVSWDPTALTPRLMLVPCRRPADAVATIGLLCGTTYGGVEDPALVSSVLRSWEDRFHTVLVGLAPGFVALAVGAPPLTFNHALRIAAEQWAFAPGDDSGSPGALARQARTLLSEDPRELTTRDVWQLGWND